MIRSLLDIFLLAEKDIRVELRTKESLFATALFVVLLLFIFYFSFGDYPEMVQKMAPGVIWATIAFSGSIALPHLARRDLEDRVIEGLLLSGKGGPTLFFAKFLSATVFLFAIEVILIPLFILFFHFPIGNWLYPLVSVVGLGTIGYAALGTLFSGLLSHTRLKDLFLPIVLYPILIPWFIVAVKTTSNILQGDFSPDVYSFFLGFDLIFVSASAMLYEFVVEDIR